MAGTDTSAGTMEWALSLLLNHPDVLKNAQSEIDENVGHDRLLREADIDKLPYLHCIIKEAIRLHPVRPILAPRESSEKCSVEGYRLPAGTMLLVNAWAIQNDPKYWEDASEFRPERFARFHGSDDAIKSKFIPFGYGTRGCPGEYLAMRMVVLGVGSLIQCFDWQRAGKELADMTEGGGLTLLRAKPLMTYCRARALAAGILSHMYSQYEA